MTSKKKTIGGSRDLISHLTDELICHILSFLPTKEAASTSVLSKRWKPKTPLLAFVPNLYFDNSKNFNLPMTNAKREEKNESFKRFLNNVLILQAEVKAPLKTFNVKCKDVEIYLVIDWIRKVLERGVSDIDISTSSYRGRSSSLSFYHLPSEIFVSKTLVRLKIDFVSGVKISVEGDVSLPKLKTLHLNYFQIGTRMLNKLLSGCLVLEELLLDNLKWDSKESKPCSVIISLPTLQRLSFSHYEDGESDEVIPSVPISFDNSNLVYLEYYDTIAAGYENVSFNSLVEASLGLRRTSFPDKMNLTKVLIGICNVKILYLSYDTLKALVCCCETIPVFDNLVQLTIETAQYVGWKPLPFLLKNCPNLETLVFEGLHHKYTDYRCNDQGGCLCEGQDNLMVKPEVDACFSSSSVKVVKILQFGEITDDGEYIYDQIDHVKNLLATMPNLEQMILYYTTPYDVMDVLEQLQELPRIAAAECNVKIISDEFDLSFTMSA